MASQNIPPFDCPKFEKEQIDYVEKLINFICDGSLKEKSEFLSPKIVKETFIDSLWQMKFLSDE